MRAAGRLNARVVGGRVVRAGDTVLVADTGGEAEVHYQVLCRAHHRSGDLGPDARRPGSSRSVKSSLRTATTWACRPSFRAGVHAG